MKSLSQMHRQIYWLQQYAYKLGAIVALNYGGKIQLASNKLHAAVCTIISKIVGFKLYPQKVTKMTTIKIANKYFGH